MRAYDVVDRMPDYLPEVKYPRTPGYRPEGEENKYGAWYVKTSIKGRKGGKLAGKRIVLKDTVCLAGVPMMAGASIIEGYVADVDATIVTRMLDAGGEIAGKAATEYFSYSGSSHTAPTGPVENPHKKGFSAGGSSLGLRRAGGRRRGRHGDRLRSGRLVAHSGGVVWPPRHEADLWAGAVYGHRSRRTTTWITPGR